MVCGRDAADAIRRFSNHLPSRRPARAASMSTSRLLFNGRVDPIDTALWVD
jgi:hypothetical protein